MLNVKGPDVGDFQKKRKGHLNRQTAHGKNISEH